MGEKKVEVIRRKTTTPAAKVPADKEVVKADVIAFLNLVLKQLLSQPEKISIATEEGDRTTIFEIDIGQDDFGRLIGAKGKNIAALRTLVAGMAAVNGFRAIVRVKDEDRFF